MQQPMHCYVCGKKLRSESSLILCQICVLLKIGVPEFDMNVLCLSREK